MPAQHEEQPRQAQHPKRWSVAAGGARATRRQELLRRQRQGRRDLTERVRSLVLEALQKEEEEEEGNEQQQQRGGQQQDLQQQAGITEEKDDGMELALVEPEQQQAQHMLDQPGKQKGQQGQQGQRGQRRRRQRPGDLERAQFYASQFSIPEWMVEVPADLNGKEEEEAGGGWFVMARPEGKRCLLIASGGQTVSRQLNGEVLHRFESALPNGGSASPGPANGWTLLDCIYHEHDRTYYLLDLLCWRSMELYDCTAEFRLFFLRSKFEEELEPRGAALCADAGAPDPWPFRMRPLLYYNCDAAGLRRAYQVYTPFLRDGLLFLHSAAFYELGLTPLSLLWKDAATSRYLTAQALACVLAVRRSPSAASGGASHHYELSTLEGLVVGRVSAAEVEGAWGLGLFPQGSQQEQEQGQQEQEQQQQQQVLARFRYEGAREAEADPADAIDDGGNIPAAPVPVVEGLRFEKPCSASRAMADPWSKILFNSRVRQPPKDHHSAGGAGAVAFEDLLRAASFADGSDSMLA